MRFVLYGYRLVLTWYIIFIHATSIVKTPRLFRGPLSFYPSRWPTNSAPRRRKKPTSVVTKRLQSLKPVVLQHVRVSHRTLLHAI